ncbi:cytochrome P450 [Nocardia sp. 2YAB30]|uniref:cytochrome P450 n=1 Tax=unclassified Nocardia TaxID=2637762 RepID=UPI003F9BE792
MSDPAIAVVPGGLPLLGHALQFRKDPLGFFGSLREYGDIVQVKLGPQRVYVINSATLAHEMLVDKPRKFDKGASIEITRDLVGYGLASSEGAMHRSHRRLMQPVFRRERIVEYAQIMREQIVEQIGTWREGQVLDVRQEMAALSFAVAAKTLVRSHHGKELEQEMRLNMPRIFELLYQRMIAPLPVLNRLPLARNREYTSYLARLHPIIDKLIVEYRAEGNSRNDLLALLIEARDSETAGGLSDEEIHDQIITIMVAGSETNSATLTWVFYLLSKHPEVERRLHEEVDRVLGDRPADYADVPNLVYTAQVISEALRCYPPAWILTRRANEDLELGGHTIPNGSSVMLCSYAVQRDPRSFADPDTFDPDRWSPQRVGEIPHKAMLHFGAGPRRCIGDVFAVVEATLAVSTIAARWRLRPDPGATTALETVVAATLIPRSLLLTAEKRR